MPTHLDDGGGIRSSIILRKQLLFATSSFPEETPTTLTQTSCNLLENAYCRFLIFVAFDLPRRDLPCLPCAFSLIMIGQGQSCSFQTLPVLLESMSLSTHILTIQERSPG